MEQPVQEMHSVQIDLNATGDKAVFSLAMPIKVIRVGLIIQNSDANDATIKFDKRVTAGSDSGRVAGGVASLSKPASNNQGKYLYKSLDDSSAVELTCGDEIVVNVTAENVAANAFAVAVLEYCRIQEKPANLSDALLSS
jgi:hypothetical protein